MSTLRIEPVTPDNVELLIRYSSQHGAEHDSSYLPGPGFEITPEQPSYLLLRGSEVVGAASLMLVPRYTRMGSGRFAILHSTLALPEAYHALHAAVRRHTGGVRKVFLFLPDHRTQTAAILEGLDFAVERYSYVLRKAPAESIDGHVAGGGCARGAGARRHRRRRAIRRESQRQLCAAGGAW